MIVAAVEEPNLIGNARGIRAERIIIALHIDDALPLFFFLAHDVAENTALLFLEPFARGTQFILDAARHENCAGDFGMSVWPLFTRKFALVLKNAYVFKTDVFLQIGDAGNPDGENSINLFVT